MTPPLATVQEPLYEPGRLLIFGAATAMAAGGSRWLPASNRGWMLLSISAIALAIWHGAFDGVLAEEALSQRFGAHWRPAFYISYVASAGAVVLLWWTVPVVALAGFLLYSALHFGTETERALSPARVLIGTATGFVPIAAACHWWPQEVAAIFEEMLRGDAAYAAAITALAAKILWPVAAVALWGAWQTRGRRWVGPSLLVMTELVLFRWCSPVVAFAVFFCLWHTPEHMVSTSLDRTGRFQGRRLAEHLRRGAGPWVTSLTVVAVGCWFGRHEAQAYAGVVFIALSALTVPHMALAEVCGHYGVGSPERRIEGFASGEW